MNKATANKLYNALVVITVFIMFPLVFIIDANESLFNIDQKYIDIISPIIIVITGFGMTFILFKNFIEAVRGKKD